MAHMKALLADRVMKARRPGTCPLCRGPIQVGEQIGRVGFWAHTVCIVDRFTPGPPTPGDKEPPQDSDAAERLAEAHQMMAALMDAIDHEAEAAYRHAMARDAYRRGREEGWAAGYIACVEDWKKSEHAAVETAWLVAAHFRDIRWPEFGEDDSAEEESGGAAA